MYESYNDALVQLGWFDPLVDRPFDFKDRKGWVRLLDVYDGDTITVLYKADNTYFKHNVRLLGIDTPEMRGSGAEAGLSAKHELLTLLTLDDVFMSLSKKEIATELLKHPCMIYIECHGYDKYGRILARVFNRQNLDVSKRLIELGFGIEYHGGAR